MPRRPAPPGRGPGETLARAAHAPGDPQPDPTWGWDVAGEPIDEAGGCQPVPPGVDPMADPARWEAWLAAADSGEAPPDPEGDPGWFPDPEDPALPDDVDLDGLRAESRRIAAGKAAEQAAEAEWASRQPRDADIPQAGMRVGRRGPGMPGSARRIPGEYACPAGGFGTGQPLDVAPGGGVLLSFAEDAAGADDRFTGASDDELAGVICALDRAEATACSLKHAALAEFTRRRPYPGCGLEGPAQMPESRDEFAGDEIAQLLAEGRGTTETMLDLARDLEVKLPGTKAAFRAGTLRHSKAQIIAWATAMLDPGEARTAEEKVLDRAGRLTPGGLRSAIARAVMEVAPEKARKRREDAEKDARVQRWAEDSGNAALAGRELPPAEVLAADQRISWWARQLKKAGLAGSMDELRARAYLDLLLDKDSRPAAPAPPTDGTSSSTGEAGQPGEPGEPGQTGETGETGATEPGGSGGSGGSGGGAGTGGPGDGGSGPPDPAAPMTAPGAGVRPAGFAGRLHLTVPLTTLLDLADRPGEIPGLGPVDPWLARDLARAAAANPTTTWCLTVTDQEGHAIGHGCARLVPRNHEKHPGGQPRPRAPEGRGPPDPPGGISRDGPGSAFAVTAGDQAGPPDGYGSWRLTTGVPGQRDWVVAVDPIATGTCDHRFEAAGHDPGRKLRHLTQIRHATCTAPTCRRPATHADFEHNVPYQAGGRTCLCNGGPKCRHDHRLKQDPRWKVEQITPATFRWTAPSGRTCTTEPTRYPI